MWSPMFGTSESVTFPMLAAFPNALLASRIANLFGFGVVMAVVAILGEKARPAFEKGPLLPIAVALCMVGMIAGCLVGVGLAPIEMLPAASFARGLFYGVITIAWINVLVHLEGGSAGAAIAAALILYAAAGLCMFPIAQVAPVLTAVFLSLCPLLSYMGCEFARKKLASVGPVEQENTPMPLLSRWKLYLANFAFGVMLGGILYYFALYDTVTSVAAFLLVAIVLFVVFSCVAKTDGLYFVFRVFLLCYAVSAAAFSLVGSLDGGVVTLLSSAALAVLVFYTIVIFMDTQGRMSSPFWQTPGVCQVFAAAGMIAAAAAVQYAFPTGSVPPSFLMVLTASCAIFISSTFSPTARTKIRPWGFSSLVPEESPEIRVLRRCGELAHEHKLTTRELEILQQLARGVSNDEIAAALVISPATVKTHVRNIYAKLGIHSKRELENLFS